MRLWPGKPNAASVPTLQVADAGLRAMGWGFLVLGFGGFLVWAATAPLDQGVAVSGVVSVAGSHQLVQPAVSGILRAINAREGGTVHRGELLVELDATEARAQLQVVSAQMVSAQAVQARLLAELSGSAEPSLADGNNPPAGVDADLVKSTLELQRQLLRARRANLQADLAVLRETAAGVESQARGVRAARQARLAQMELLRTELAGLRGIAEEGFLPRNRVSEQERALSQLGAGLAEDEATLERLRDGGAEIALRMRARQEEQRRDLATQLADTAREITGLRSRLQAFAFEVDHARILAPADGVVVSLNVHTVGGVVQAGASLMDIVPADALLQVEAQVGTALIDKVKPDLVARLMFPAFNVRTTPRVDGRVQTVSADAIIDPVTRAAFYRVTVQVPATSLKQLGANQIRPGMPAQVYIRTGERTMLNYLFKPLRDRLHASMNED